MRGNTACKVLWHTHVHITKKKIKIKREAKPSKNLLSIRDQRIFIATSLSAPPLTGKWRSRLTDNEATDGAADRERIFSNDPLLTLCKTRRLSASIW